MRTTPFLTVLLTALIAGTAHAKDFGVQGTTWPIIERDMREFVLESASRTDWNAVNEERRASAFSYADNLAKRTWPQTLLTETEWMDPSIELTSDVQSPTKGPDGKITWQVMLPKGTRANPLTKIRPATAMLFFDGADPAQLALVDDLLKAVPGLIDPIETGAGNVKESNKRLKVPVYHASDAAISRFQIRSLPTLVYPGDGAHSLNLGITRFAAPYSLDTVLRTWQGFTPFIKTSKVAQ